MERLLWKKTFRRRPGARLTRVGLACAGFLAVAVTTLAAGFTASLDRDTLTLGESARLTLTFEDVRPSNPPALPSIANLQITHNGQSSQYQFVNGKSTSLLRHNYTVTPRQPGDYTIPALSFTTGGQTLTTQPLRLKTIKAGATATDAASSGQQQVFLRLALPKTNVYLGEVITGEIQLYLRDGVQGLSQFQFTGTPTEGVSVGKMSEGQRRRAQIGNASYTLVPVSVAFMPNKTGPLSIGPVTAGVVIELPARSIQEQFFGGHRSRVNLATEALTLQCLPLPAENAPADFNGAVGQYTMAVSVGPTNVATGDPITVRVQITGRGALDSLTLPAQSAWHDFKTYPPTARVETGDPLGLQGAKTFEQIIAPQSADITELPSLTFSFFDPDAKRYETLRHPAVKLTVRPGGSSPAPVIAALKSSEPEPAPPQQDIVPIKPHPGDPARLAGPLAAQPWFLALQCAPVLAFVTARVWRRRADSLANNPRLRRRLAVAQIIRDGTRDLRRLAAENRADEFFATLFRLLQEQLGERLDCPASAITEAVVDEKLRPRGVPDSMLEGIHELFQSCNVARYAPTQSGGELAALIPKFENILREIREARL
jgi:hypothetical protein